MKLSLPQHIQLIVVNEAFQVVSVQGNVAPLIDSGLLEMLVESAEAGAIAPIEAPTDGAVDHSTGQFAPTAPGLSPEQLAAQLLGLEIYELFPELFGIDEILVEVAAGDRPEFNIKGIGRVTAHGSPIYFDIHITAHPSPTPEHYLIFFLEDVTDRMSLEQVLVQATNEKHLLIRNLEETKQQIDQIISAMSEMLLLVSEAGLIRMVNPATRHLLGYEAEELIGQPMSAILARRDAPSAPEPGHLLAAEEGEAVCQTKTGAILVIAFSRSRLTNTLTGQLGRAETVQDFLYVGRDVTEEKRRQRYQSVQHLITRIISESNIATQALSAVVRALCQEFDWQLGEFWLIDRTDVGSGNPSAHCIDHWLSPMLEISHDWKPVRCLRLNEDHSFLSQVWQETKAKWQQDLPDQAVPAGTLEIQNLNFKTGFGFPIKTGDQVLGILLFFKQASQLVSPDLLNLGESLGSQLGQYVERRKAEEALLLEQEKSERLLLNILPETIAHCLKRNARTIAEQFAAVTVLFADIVGFTEIASNLSAIELVELLNEIFSEFDQLTEIHGLEKIKTIGDSYMVVAGLPTPRADHAQAIANMALDMQLVMGRFNDRQKRDFQIRIGIHSGSVVAGVIGLKKFIYDLWGDTVNTASRMESHGIPGRIQTSAATYALLKNSYQFEHRGLVHIKGKGDMDTYFLLGHMP